MGFGKAIRRLRMDRGWKQEELARRSGIRQGYISDIELGKKENPTQETLVKLAGAFGISVSDLLQEAGIVAAVAELSDLGVPSSQLAELTAIWGVLPPEDRETALSVMRSLYERLNRRVEQGDGKQTQQPNPANS